MSFLDKLKTKLETIQPPKPLLATDELAKERLAICESCEYLIKSTYQCKKCLCFMSLKTRLEKAECPIKKW